MNTGNHPVEASDHGNSVGIPAGMDDSLRPAVPRKRDRQWEKKHQSRKAVYRGVDPKYSLRVKSIAGDLGVPTGEVARRVIEFSLRAYEQDDLDLRPRLNPYSARMTLFPVSNSGYSHARPTKTSKRKRREVLWQVITTWRGFPPDLKNKLAALASQAELNVPLGELITVLLRYGLKAYDCGLLIIEVRHEEGAP